MNYPLANIVKYRITERKEIEGEKNVNLTCLTTVSSVSWQDQRIF